MKDRLGEEIHRYTKQIYQSQRSDGSWRFCFQSGSMTNAYMILLIKSLNLEEKDLMDDLSCCLLSTQHESGAWQLFPDNQGNLSATVEAILHYFVRQAYKA